MHRFERIVVWAGGAAFVASLAMCTWWYLVVFGRTTATPAGSAAGRLLLDIALFSAFALHHSLFARTGVKHAVASWLPARLERSSYVWLASALLIAVCVWWQPLGAELYRASGITAVLLVGVQVTGVWLIARSVRAIDALELAGIRAHARPGTPDGLQTGGPYGLVRHPLYLGWIVAVFAHPHMTGDRLVFAAISTIYLLAAVPLEERSLGATFGRAYDEYRRRVRWRVIPFVY